MVVEAKRFLEFSEQINAQTCELHARTKINRSYYAAYHTAKANVAPKLGSSHIEYAKSSHEDVVQHYLHGAKPSHKSIGYTLRDLKRHRHEADYHLADSLITATDADQAHHRCAELIVRIEGLPDLTAKRSDGSSEGTPPSPAVPHSLSTQSPRLTIVK